MSERTFLDLSGSSEAERAVLALAEELGISLKRLPAPTRFEDIAAQLKQHRPAFVLVRPDIMFLSRALRVKQAWFPPALAFVKGTPTDDTVEDLRERGVSSVITPKPTEPEKQQFESLCEARTWLKVRLSQMPLMQLLKSLDDSETFLITAATSDAPAVSDQDWNSPGQKAWYGRIYVKDGAVVYCETPGKVGKGALERLLELSDGFAVVQKVFLEPKQADAAAPVQVITKKLKKPVDGSAAPPKPKRGHTMRGLGMPGQTHPGVAPPPETANGARSAAVARPKKRKPPPAPFKGRQVASAAALEQEVDMPATPRHLQLNPMTGLVAVPPPPRIANVEIPGAETVTSSQQPETARQPAVGSATEHVTMEFEAPTRPDAGPGMMLSSLVRSESSLVSAAACTEDGWVDGVHGHIDGETQAAAAALGYRHVRSAGQLLGLGAPVGYCIASENEAAYVAAMDKRVIVARGSLGSKPLSVLEKMRAFIENSIPTSQR